MSKCFIKSHTCISVTLNIILFILGIALLSGGIYAKMQIDLEKLLGTKYKEAVPPVKDFVSKDYKGSEDLATLQKKADDFVKKGIDEVNSNIQRLVTVVIGFGIFTATVASLGIIALTCCKKKDSCVFIYMVCLIIVIIPFIVPTVYVAYDAILRGLIFEQLDQLAFKKEFENRFFMAAIQNSFKCCAVRSPVEYFCSDLYDYACNAGCMTIEPIWKTMKNNMSLPVCKKEAKLVDACKKLVKDVDLQLKPGTTEGDCIDKLNVPKPIKGSGQDMCKWRTQDWDKQLRDKKFLEENSKKVKEIFKGSDPAFDTDPNSNFQIFGSPLKEQGEITAQQGCGYAIWSTIPHLNQYLNYALIFCVILLLLLLFQFFTALLICIWNKKEKKGSKSKRVYGSDIFSEKI